MRVYKGVLTEKTKTNTMLRLKFLVPDLPRINNINPDYCFVIGYIYLEQYPNSLDFGISVGAVCIIEFENYKDFKIIFNANL